MKGISGGSFAEARESGEPVLSVTTKEICPKSSLMLSDRHIAPCCRASSHMQMSLRIKCDWKRHEQPNAEDAFKHYVIFASRVKRKRKWAGFEWASEQT